MPGRADADIKSDHDEQIGNQAGIDRLVENLNCVKSEHKGWTVRQLLDTGTDYLRLAGFDEPKSEARFLLSHLLDIDTTDFYRSPEKPVDNDKLNMAFAGLIRRMHHEPAAYITGYTGFYGREFLVGPGTLIPRPDTEILIEHAVDVSKKMTGMICILDTCTGSGCIGITIALELIKSGREVRLDLVDIDEQAISCAQKNVLAFKLEKIAACHLADLWPQHGKWDIITANPPYIESSVLPELQPEVSEYEPALALDGGRDGLLFYHRLAAEAVTYIRARGVLVLEHGYDQADSVRELLQKNGWHGIIQLKDYGGHSRVTAGRI